MEPQDEVTRLLRAAGHGKLAIVRDFVAKGMPVNATNHLGYTALMSACASYRVEVVSFLLDSGASTSLKTTDGRTALHAAVSSTPSLPEDQKECVRILLEHGARMNIQDQSGITPLMNAAWFGCETAVREMLKHGADKLLRDVQGRTAEDLARLKNRTEVIRLLVLPQ